MFNIFISARLKTLTKMALGAVSGLTLLVPTAPPAVAVARQVAVEKADSLSVSMGANRRVPQQPNSENSRQSRRRPTPPRRLPPNRVQPGGGLDIAVQSCDPASPPLTALVPRENPVYTASTHPTFLFYLPDPPETVDYAEFILLSADEKQQLYSARFVPVQAGVVSISLPAAATALDPEQPYHWYLNLHCQTTDAVPAVNGWIQRLVSEAASPTATPDPETPDPENLPLLWYDEIARLYSILLTQQPLTPAAPGELAQAQARSQWADRLAAIGLDALVDAPLAEPAVPQVSTSRAQPAGLSDRPSQGL